MSKDTTGEREPRDAADEKVEAPADGDTSEKPGAHGEDSDALDAGDGADDDWHEPGSAPDKKRRPPIAALVAGGAAIVAAVVVVVLAVTGAIAPGETDQGRQQEAVSSSVDEQGSSTSASSEPFSAPTAYTNTIQSSVNQVIQASGADVSVTYMVVSSPANGFNIGGDTVRPAASMIKLLVLAELLQQAQDGAVSLDDQLTVTDQDAVGGTGVIAGTVGTSYTLDQLALHMIADSDNTACNMLIDLLGTDAINQEAADLGLTGTSLERLMMDTDAIAAGIENRMCSNDAALILQKIASGTLVSPEMSEVAMGYLQAQTLDSGLAAGTGADVEVAHKTGSLVGAEHDGGVVMATTPYVLVVMTQGMGTEEADALIAQIAQRVYAIQTKGQNAGNLLTAQGSTDQAAAEAAAEAVAQEQGGAGAGFTTYAGTAGGTGSGGTGAIYGGDGAYGIDGQDYQLPENTPADTAGTEPAVPQPEVPGGATDGDAGGDLPGGDGPAGGDATNPGGDAGGGLPGGDTGDNPGAGGDAGGAEGGAEAGGDASDGGGSDPGAGGDAGGEAPLAPVTGDGEGA